MRKLLKTLQKIDYHSIEYRDVQGKLHRLSGPAFETINGYKIWYKHGIIHRSWQDGPAIINEDGGIEYRVNGVRHRPIEVGPAVVTKDNKEYYYENGDEFCIKTKRRKNLFNY